MLGTSSSPTSGRPSSSGRRRRDTQTPLTTMAPTIGMTIHTRA
jgi:hypothetical protein